MGYIPDLYEKTVKLPVRITQGRVTLLYGGLLPAIADDTIGELIVPHFCIIDPGAKEILEQESIQEFLPEGAKILLGMKRSKIPERLLEKTCRPRDEEFQNSSLPNYRFVELFLKEDLLLMLRNTKPARLLNCECFVPTLNFRARSLNQAYSVTSAFFEPDRRSHAGNVFRLAMYFDDRLRCWRQLDELRKHYEAEYERKIIEV